MNIRFDHIMMHTVDIQKSIAFFQKTLGMTLENTDEYDTFRLAYLKDESTNVKFELREVFDQEKQPNGNVLGHFAFYVDDVDEVIDRFFEFYSANMTDIKENHLKIDGERYYWMNASWKYEHHVSHKHGKEYLIFTFWSPDGVEMSALQKIVG